MKAVYFDGEQLQLREDYPSPADNEVLVRVLLAGICGTDLEILRGYNGFNGVPGHEFVGCVAEASGSTLLGQRVVAEINIGCGRCANCQCGLQRHCAARSVIGIRNHDGAFAEYLCVPIANLHDVPDTVSDKQAVFVEPLAAAFEILEQVEINTATRVAVIGDGRLGQLVARVLAGACDDVTCFGHHGRKLERLNRLGIATRTTIAMADRHQFELVIEACGRGSGLPDAFQLVRARGTIVLKTTMARDNKCDLTPAVINEVTVTGSRCGPFTPALRALQDRTVTVDDLVDEIYALDHFDQAFHRARQPDAMKVLLQP